MESYYGSLDGHIDYFVAVINRLNALIIILVTINSLSCIYIRVHTTCYCYLRHNKILKGLKAGGVVNTILHPVSELSQPGV